MLDGIGRGGDDGDDDDNSAEGLKSAWSTVETKK